MSHDSREHLASESGHMTCNHLTSDHVSCEEGGDDVYLQLAQREHELMLAAELGKALLEKNQELNGRNEQIVEEFSLKVEGLTQEKHGLKLKLETLETEYETTVRELQNDITLLSKALEEKDSDHRNGHKEKSDVIEELMQQNEKLAEQLKKAHETEKELRSQLRSLHDEMDMRSHTTQDTIMCMDALNKQMSAVKRKREELESKLRQLTEERSGLVESLDDSQDRLTETEKQCKQQKQQISELEKTVEELRDRNQQLQDRLTTSHHGNSVGDGGNDLYSELSQSGLSQAMSTESLDGAGRVGQQDWVPSQQYGMTFYGCDPSMFDEDEIECDEIDYAMKNQGNMGYHGNSGSESPVSQKTLTSVSSRDSLEDVKLREEVLDTYTQLQQLVCELRGDQWTPDTQHDMKSGQLQHAVKLVREAVEGLIHRQDPHTLSPEVEERLDTQQAQISSLQRKLRVAETEVDKMAAEVMFKEEQVMRRREDVQSLAKQIKHSHEVCDAVRRERDRLLDQQLKVTECSVISQVREERESAVQRKYELELELARSRLDMVHLDQQLLDAVQQKLDLSQQLELWQVDMQELIDKQVSKRIKEDRKEKTKAQTRINKTFNLFKR